MPEARESSIVTHPVLVAGVLTAFHTFYGASPATGDRWTAVPIALESGWPGTYPTADLLVQSGLHGGYHLYVALGKLASLGIPLSAIWEVGLLASVFLLMLLALHLFEWLTGRRDIAVLSAAVLMAMPPLRGSLVWSPIPWQEFVVGSVGNDLALLALLALWKRWWMVAGVAAGVLCNIHPSMGSIAVVLMLGAAVVWWTEDRGRIVRALAAAALLASPNVFVMMGRLYGGQAGTASPAGLIALIEPFNAQYTIRNHVDSGLGFYASMLVLALAGSRHLARDRRRDLLVAVAALHGLMAIYIVGADVFRSAFIGLFFWFRTTAYVKVLAMPLCVLLAAGAWNATGSAVRRARLGALLALAAIVQNHTVAASLMLLAVAIVLVEQGGASARGLAVALVLCAMASIAAIGWRHLGIPVASDAVRVGLVIASGIMPLFAVPLVLRAPREEPPDVTASASAGWWLPASAAILVLSLLARHPYDSPLDNLSPERWSAVHARVLWDEPAGDMADVERWARDSTSRDAMFVVPPDGKESTTFRVRARRGVFVTLADIAQMTYAPTNFLVARQRAALVGMRIVNGHPDVSGYDALDDRGADALRQAGAAYLVFRRATAPRLSLPSVYSDAAWLVYGLDRGPGSLRK